MVDGGSNRLLHGISSHAVQVMTALDGDATGRGPFRREVHHATSLTDDLLRKMLARFGFEERDDGFWYRSATEDRALDRPAMPKDAAHDRAFDVARDLVNGRITQPGRRLLRDALDKADVAPTGRAASDGALGRAVR
jgi:hypothetical protein